jgi:hypothetical protein
MLLSTTTRSMQRCDQNGCALYVPKRSKGELPTQATAPEGAVCKTAWHAGSSRCIDAIRPADRT